MTSFRAPRPARRTPRGTARRAATLLVASLVAVLIAATPASADAPLGWDPAKESVEFVHILWLLIGIPLAIIVIIAALVYLPAVARGENVRPSASLAAQAEWIGGPRRTEAELAAPDTAESQAGGASGRW